MKTLLLVRGLPGAGKTTFVNFLKDSMGSLSDLEVRSYAADDWMVNEIGEYEFDRKKLSYCHDQCQASVEWDMNDGFDCIAVHNTLTTEKEVEDYMRLAERYRYRVISLIVENRHGGTNTHDAPETTITKMRNRFSVKL